MKRGRLARVLVCLCAVAALSVVAPLQPKASTADCLKAELPPSPEYLKLVTRYASGEHAYAVALLGSWNDDQLRCDLDNLRTAALRAKRCTACPERLVFERFPVRAAILLHADREVLDQFRPPVNEQPPQCGTGAHSRVVERLAALLFLVDPEPGAFLRRFYLGMARHAQWSHCLAQAQQWARAGLKWFPKDGTLLLTLGIAGETHAFYTLVPAPRTLGMRPRSIRQLEAQTASLSGLWERAGDAFEKAFTADPDLHEARLRFGRVLWRLKKPEPARACFEAVLARSDDESLQYLAHLFLGRIHEDQGQLAEAEKEYRAALLLQPISEPAAVAVSHARLLLGDPGSAQEVLGRALQHARRRTEFDPYKQYPMAHTPEGQTILAELRREGVR